MIAFISVEFSIWSRFARSQFIRQDKHIQPPTNRLRRKNSNKGLRAAENFACALELQYFTECLLAKRFSDISSAFGLFHSAFLCILMCFAHFHSQAQTKIYLLEVIRNRYESQQLLTEWEMWVISDAIFSINVINPMRGFTHSLSLSHANQTTNPQRHRVNRSKFKIKWFRTHSIWALLINWNISTWYCCVCQSNLRAFNANAAMIAIVISTHKHIRWVVSWIRNFLCAIGNKKKCFLMPMVVQCCVTLYVRTKPLTKCFI